MFSDEKVIKSVKNIVHTSLLNLYKVHSYKL